MNKTKAWISALRLRTLPLSISGILVGSGMAAIYERWNPLIFTFALLTTVSFQIVSNLANDLGDTLKGTDNHHRVGPIRAVQSGLISKGEMLLAIIISVIFSFVSAGLLIYFSKENLHNDSIYLYCGLAVLSIVAAITYTLGKTAYGYRGLGDLMVFIFFGLVSVIGVFGLYGIGMSFEWLILLPAISIGLWSCAVLNLNNLRDIENDRSSGKKTLIVRLGYERGKLYHAFLIITGFVTWLITIVMLATVNYSIFFALIPPIILLTHVQTVFNADEPRSLDPELKKVALLTFFAALLFASLLNLTPIVDWFSGTEM